MTSIYRCSPSKRSKSARGGGAGGSSGTGGRGGGGPGAWTLAGEEPQLGNPNWACAGHIFAKNIRTSMLSLSICSISTASTAKHSAISLVQSRKPSMCRSEYMSKVCTYNMHAASGLFSWRMELLASACWSMYYICHSVQLPATTTRSALYVCTGTC